MPLLLRSIGVRDYNVLEGPQLIGRIRYARERTPGIWLWNIQVHITGGLPLGSSKDLDPAKAEFKSAWEDFKSKHTAEEFEKAYKAMNIRRDG